MTDKYWNYKINHFFRNHNAHFGFISIRLLRDLHATCDYCSGDLRLLRRKLCLI